MLSAVALSGDAVLISDPDLAVTYVNETFTLLFGLPLEAVIGRDVTEVMESELIPRLDDANEVTVPIEAAYRKNRDISGMDLSIRGKEQRWITYSSHCVRKGGLEGFRIDIFRDTSRVKAAEIMIQQKEREYNALLSATPLALCRTAPDLTIISVNDAFCRAVRKEPCNPGKNLRDFLPGSIAVEIDSVLNSLSPSSPHTVIGQGTREWRVSALFTAEPVISELMWTAPVPAEKTGGVSEPDVGCLSIVHQILGEEEDEIPDPLVRVAGVIVTSVPWIAGITIRAGAAGEVTAGVSTDAVLRRPLVHVPGGFEGEILIYQAEESAEPAITALFIESAAGAVSAYLRRGPVIGAAAPSAGVWESVIGTAEIPCAVIDRDLHVVAANDRFYHLVYPPPMDHRPGADWTSFIADGDRVHVRSFHEGEGAKESGAYECGIITADTTVHQMVVTAIRIGSDGECIIWLSNAMTGIAADPGPDMDESVYRVIAENAGDVIFTLDEGLIFTYLNPSFERLCGRPVAGMIGRSPAECLTPPSFARLSDTILELSAHSSEPDLAPDTSPTVEIEVVQADGGPIWMEVQITPLTADGSAPYGFLGVMRDIRERKSTEERENEYIRELSFLSSASMGFVELPPEEEIFRFIGEHIGSLIEDTLILITDYDEFGGGILSLRSFSGIDEDRQPKLYSLSRSIVGIRIPISDEIRDKMLKGVLFTFEEREVVSLLNGHIRSIAEAYSGGVLKRCSAIGIARGNTLYGCVLLIQRNDILMNSVSTIETFIHLSSVALQRHQLGMDLEHTRSHLHHILSSSPAMIFSLEPPRQPGEGMKTITFVTENILALIGYEQQEVLYDSSFWSTYIHPVDRKRIFGDEYDALTDAGSLTLEFRIRHKDGKYRWLHTELKLIRDDEGTPTEVIGSSIDISERKRIEEALRVMDSAITSAINPITITDLEGDLVFANDSALHLWGYENAKNVIGKPLERFWLPKKKVTRLLEQIDKDGGWMGELVGRKKGGKRFNASVSASMVTDDEEDPLCIMLSFTDITERIEIEKELASYRTHLEEMVLERTEKLTRANDLLSAEVAERKKAEEAIRTSEARYRAVVEDQTEWICRFGGDLCLTFANTACQRSFGLNDENPAVSATEIMPDGLQSVLSSLEGAGDGGPQSAMFEGRRNNPVTGERWHQWTIRALYRPDGSICEYQAVGQDITERKRAEEEYLRTEKMLSLSELAGGIAHDFNNILTTIVGNLNLAKMRISPEDFVYHRLTEAEAATMRAGEITKQLFSFSDRSEPEKETVDLNEVLREAVSYSLRGSRNVCRMDLPKGTLPIQADATQIHQVLQALIQNADQAMRDGGEILVGAETVVIKEGDTVPLPPGSYVRVYVEDEGGGIPPEYINRIFDPYYTTKEHGTGLGLSMALPIIKNHGGLIDFVTEVGAGTIFFIYLPSSTENIDVKTEPEGEMEGGMGSILLMDDEIGILETTREILHCLGYSVVTATDGEEAIRLFRAALERGAPFDGVILDLTVPGKMGGSETMECLREMDGSVKVVVSSGYLNDPIMRNPRKYGFSGSITKPYMAGALSKVLRDLLST
ncbi:PAS domain-containing hybrid sensor histidine kinase/response regulator [Methanofollis fontis]|uniref:PAS domain-containing hybrid sensor histidine kinase/response regulator n=1 Tax=Methanofollis fontis TaxID=2052832 RepID=UPI0013EE6AFD|nr:PAS domain S-box protein [Methanofollis fontis]